MELINEKNVMANDAIKNFHWLIRNAMRDSLSENSP